MAKIAQLPHPYLHEYLLNPTIHAAKGARTLFGILQKLLHEKIKSEILNNVEELRHKIFVCRRTLLGSKSDRQALNLNQSVIKTN